MIHMTQFAPGSPAQQDLLTSMRRHAALAAAAASSPPTRRILSEAEAAPGSDLAGRSKWNINPNKDYHRSSPYFSKQSCRMSHSISLTKHSDLMGSGSIVRQHRRLSDLAKHSDPPGSSQGAREPLQPPRTPAGGRIRIAANKPRPPVSPVVRLSSLSCVLMSECVCHHGGTCFHE